MYYTHVHISAYVYPRIHLCWPRPRAARTPPPAKLANYLYLSLSLYIYIIMLVVSSIYDSILYAMC